MRTLLGLTAVAGGLSILPILLAQPSQARITRIEITNVEPAFAGRRFGDVGSYERVVGRAYGEVDPNHPANTIIQDIGLAPRTAKDRVQYVTDIDVLRPADRSKGNGILFFNVVNRGNKGGLTSFNADVPTGLAQTVGDNNALKMAGDGFLMEQGYTIVWFGWQGDVLSGNDRMTFSVPTAKNPDGSAITGLVRGELIVRAPAKTLNLSSGWFTLLNHASYATVGVDNRAALADGFSANTDRQVQGARAADAYRQQRVEFRFLRGERAVDCRRSANLFSFGISAGAYLRTHLPRQGSSCPRTWVRGDA